MLNSLPEILRKILGIVSNWGKWSEMVEFKLFDFIFGWRAFENILSKRILKWLVILVGCKIKGVNELEIREYKN